MMASHRITTLLKPGGYVYLEDAIFSFPIEEYTERLPRWIEGVRARIDEELALEAEAHVREEYSTYDWVIESMLSRVGLTYEICKKDAYFAAYCCRKPEREEL